MQSCEGDLMRVVVLLSGLIALPLLAGLDLRASREWAEGLGRKARSLLSPAETPQSSAEPLLVSAPLRYQAERAARWLETPLRTRPRPETDSAPPVILTGNSGATRGASEPMDAFQPLQERLRELGAVSFALERWGSGGAMFRFRAEVPIGRDPALRRDFQEVSSDAERAVERVVQEVERWRRSSAR